MGINFHPGVPESLRKIEVPSRMKKIPFKKFEKERMW